MAQLPPRTGDLRSAPFVLLDDASVEGLGQKARLYQAPAHLVVARRPEEIAPALEQMEALLAQGYALAGTLAYEAGLALEPKLAALAAARSGADGPLVWMGAFDSWEELTSAQVAAFLAMQANNNRPSRLGPMVPAIGPGAYAQAFDHVAEAIRAGDIYQANFTFPLEGPWSGDPLALYAQLRKAGGGAHGGLIYDGSHYLLSLSPELFFDVEQGALRAKPMKGTRPRGATPDQDAEQARDLAQSIKDRAENLMILDLMRNDISRVAQAGSVRVEAPFAVESYPTVHQMVSTVRAQLGDGLGVVDVLRALFPCGSITGAPKIRAMELIHAHERDPRGAYCGAIGHIDPLKLRVDPTNTQTNAAGAAAFNVAIRSLRLTVGEGGSGTAVLGVGSAVVADSLALPEWRECLVKGGFVHQPAPDRTIAQFDLIETMGFHPDLGIPLLELHLERMKASAALLGFSFDRHAARNAIQALCFEADQPSRLRLVLARSGATGVELHPAPAPMDADGPVPCAVLPLPVDEGDWRLQHKTSDRWFYQAGLKAGQAVGAGETLFLRDDGLLTEGCFTSIFVERDGVLLTPPASLGLLPGVLRQSLLAEGRAREAELRLEDLEQGFFIGNALRGLMKARLLG